MSLLQAVEQLEAELSATKEKLAKAEENFERALDARQLHYDRAEAAENRIRESQEQEPVGEAKEKVCALPWVKWYMKAQTLKDGDKLYAMPPIPPELAELQRENAELRKQLESLND